MSQHGGELTSLKGTVNKAHESKKTDLVKTGTEKSGNLLDDGLGSEEGIVALGKLLDELLVLVELLELIGGFRLNADLVGLIDMLGITDDADLLLWSGDVGEPKLRVSREKSLPLDLRLWVGVRNRVATTRGDLV